MKIIRLGQGLLCALLLPLALHAAPLSDGLLCYVPFDGTAAPAFAKGVAQAAYPAPVFVPGKQGQALSIPAGAPPFALLARNNFDRRAGTVAFWVNLGWNPQERGGTQNLLFADENFQLSYEGGKVCLFFMTGKVVPQEGYHWDYGTESSAVRGWSPGEWHHIAMTWDAAAGQKALYLDGQLVSHNQTAYLRNELDAPDSHFKLGDGAAPVSFDELAIWNRVLDSDEIAELWGKPAAAAGEMLQAAANAPAAPVNIAAPLEWTLVAQPDPAQLIVAPGQPITAHLPVNNRTALPFHETVHFHLFDFWEKSVATQDVAVDLKPGEQKTLDVSFTPARRGVFKIGVEYDWQGSTLARDVFSFAAWPEPKAQPDADSFFGSHIESFSENTVRLAARLGETWNRDHNMLQTTWWARQQPEPGPWNSVAESMLDYNKKYQLHVLGQFFGVPYWGAADGAKLPWQKAGVYNYPYPGPPDLDAFQKYVLHVVGTYKGEINDWEIWNEPEVSLFWRGTPAQFAEMAKVAYQSAKQADPNCTVMLGGFTTPAWRWHEAAAQAGAFKYADAISFHYGDGDTSIPPEANDASLKSIIRHFEDLAVKYGPGREMPMWSTEGGIDNTTWLRGLDYDFLPPPEQRVPLNWHLAAIRIVQGEVVLQANGIVKHFYYFQHTINPHSAELYQNTSLMELTRAPKPLWIARMNLAEQVAGCAFQTTIKRTEGRVWASLYKNAATGEVVAVCWAGDNGVVKVDAAYDGAPFQQIDLMGNEVKPEGALTFGEPCYLHFKDPLEKVEHFFQTAPFEVVQRPDPLSLPNDAGSSQANVPPLPDYVAVHEAPNHDFPIDLKSAANMGLADQVPNDNQGGWTDQGPLNDARDLETGQRTFYGVPVDIADPAANGGKSILVLRGKVLTPHLPSRIDGIAVGKGTEHIRALYFLQASAWAGQAVIGNYVIHYASGKTLEVPIAPGKNIADWWSGYQPDEDSRPVPFLSRQNQNGKPQWRYLRLWEWQNPTPEDPVVSFDFVSSETDVTPILVAVTALRVP